MLIKGKGDIKGLTFFQFLEYFISVREGEGVL